MKKTLFMELISSALILLFTYTALQKLFTYDQFNYTLSKIPGLKRVSAFAAIAIPVVELMVSAGLLYKKTRSNAMLSSAALLSIFTVYISFLVLFVPELPCNCGGVISTLSWKQHIAFNASFVLLSIVGYKLSNNMSNKRFIAIKQA